MKNEKALEFLVDRKSVRQFNRTHEISTKDIHSILEDAATAPSGNNFQPWKVVVVKNKELQAKLKELSANQPQVETASAVFLLYGDKSAYEYSKLVDFNLKNKILDDSSVEQFTQTLDMYFGLHPEDREFEGLKLDVSLFAMNLMHVVRAYGFESVPMRGVDFNAVKELLSLDDNLLPVLMLPVGVAEGAGYEKARYVSSDFATIIE